MSLCALNEIGAEKRKTVFPCTELCVRGFFLFFVLHQFKRIERNRGGQEILLNGKAA